MEVRAVKLEKTPATFLGRPLNKYDIDEIEIDPELAKASYFAELPGARALGKMTALTMSIPTSQKSLSVHDQVVRDEQGRRRFHGAFTGGFSAGYFNTVGSAEGWVPSSFQSSRVKGAEKTFRNRIEDFMDEEDLENMTSQHHSVKLVNHKRPLPGDDFDSVINASSESSEHNLTAVPVKYSTQIGHAILKATGWNESALLFQKKIKTMHKPFVKKVHGPQMYPPNISSQPITPQPFHDDHSSLDAVNFRQSQRKTVSQMLQVCQRYMKSFKGNLHGLGYSHKTLAELVAGNADSTVSDSRSQILAKKKKTHSEAFGIGALEEDDDAEWAQIYDDADQDELQSISVKKHVIATTQLDFDDQPIDLVDHEQCTFIEAKESSHAINQLAKLKHLICPFPSISWQPRHVPTQAELDSEQRLRSAAHASHVVQKLLKHLNQNNCLPQVVRPTEPPSQTNQQTQDDNKKSKMSTHQVDTDKPLWSLVTDEKKLAIIASLSSTTKFVPSLNQVNESELQMESRQIAPYPLHVYLEDAEKQRRFEEEKVSVRWFENSKTSIEEKKEFGEASLVKAATLVFGVQRKSTQNFVRKPLLWTC